MQHTMGEPQIEYSGSASDGEWAGQSSPGSTGISHLEQGKHAPTSAGSTLAGSPSASTEEADELMLSEFLLSLQANSGFAHMAMEASCTGAAPGAAAAAAHSVPRSLARRTTHAAGAGTAKSAAGRRTVVHRRKRRDDLAGPCNHCGALTSPQWRKGPKGKPVLCNACGIRFLRNRTLTKVMPKKRRHGAAGSKRRAAAAMATEGEEDEFLDDSMAAADEDMDEVYSAAVTAAATAAAQAAYAAAMQPGGHQHSQHLLLQASMLAAANASELYCAPDVSTAVRATASHAAAEAGAQALGAGALDAVALFEASDATANKVVTAAAAPTMSAISRDSLFSSRSNSSRSLFAQLGDCPSLTLALALHQQQQQRRQQEEQEAEEEMQQQSSKYRLPNFPELQLLPPGSPAADSAGTGFVCSPFGASMQQGGPASTYAGPAVSSPVCSSDSLLQLQHQCSSTTPPLSPLFLGAAGIPAAAAPAVLRGAAAAGADGSTGDMLQLVQQLGVALGGVGPAIEFLKLCSGNPAALAAAVAAVAASAACAAR